MNILRTLSATCGLLWALYGCQSAPTGANTNPNTAAALPPDTLKAYYYPLAQLKEGLVYEYTLVKTGQTSHYWFFKTVEDEAGNWNLVATRYGANFEQEAFTRERVYPNGMAYEMYQFYVLDTPSQTNKVYPHQILEPTAFPFEANKGGGSVYRFQSTFNLPPDMSMNYKFTRDRQFSQFFRYDYQSQQRDAAEFLGFDYLVLNDTAKGGYFTLDSADIREVYVKDIGLVYAERKLPSGERLEATLKARYPMDSFLAKIPESALPKQRMPKK